MLNAGVGMIPANDRVATVHGRRERPQGGGGRGGGSITNHHAGGGGRGAVLQRQVAQDGRHVRVHA